MTFRYENEIKLPFYRLICTRCFRNVFFSKNKIDRNRFYYDIFFCLVWKSMKGTHTAIVWKFKWPQRQRTEKSQEDIHAWWGFRYAITIMALTSLSILKKALDLIITYWMNPLARGCLSFLKNGNFYDFVWLEVNPLKP